MNLRKGILLPVLLTIAGLIFQPGYCAFAQGMHTTATSMALGGGGSAYVPGYHAAFVNPANLMLPERDTRITLGVLGGVRSSAGGSLVNISLYNKHFTKGHVLDSDRVMDISDDWFGTSRNAMGYAGADVSVVPLGASYRRDRMAFSSAIRARTLSSARMSKGFFELALTGLSSKVFKDPKNVDLSGEFLGMWEWSFGYAMEVWRNSERFEPGAQRIYAGIAPKLLFGMGYARIGLESSLQVTGQNQGQARVHHEFDYKLLTVGNLTDDLEAYYQERRVRGNEDALLSDFVDDDSFSDLGGVFGTGFGLDLGATWEWYRGDIDLPVIGSGPQIIRASFSITDIGAISFDDNAGEFRAADTFDWEGVTVDFDYIDREHDGDVLDYLEYVVKDSIGSDIYGNFSSRETSSHRIGLTPAFTFGGAVTMGKLGVMLDIGKGINNRGVNSRRFYTALGSQYMLINAIPLRFGIRAGGGSSVNLSFGTGVDVRNFEFSFSVMTTPGSERRGGNIGAALSGFVVRF